VVSDPKKLDWLTWHPKIELKKENNRKILLFRYIFFIWDIYFILYTSFIDLISSTQTNI